jgi:hypothetical protein
MRLRSINVCRLLVALFCKFRDLKYCVSPLQVHKSCSINFNTRTCWVAHCASPHSFPSARTWEETNVNVIQNDKHYSFVTQWENNFFFFWWTNAVSKNRPLLLDNGHLVQLILQVCTWFWQFMGSFFIYISNA